MVKTSPARGPILSDPVDCLVVSVFGDKLGASAQALDEQIGGAIATLSRSGEIKGTPGEVTKLLAHHDRAPVIAVLGMGEGDIVNPRSARRAASAAAKALAGRPRDVVEFRLDLENELTAHAAVVGAISGGIGCDLHRAEPNLHAFRQLRWAGLDDASLQQAAIVGQATNLTKRLVNQPASHIFPVSFAEEAREIASSCGLDIEVWGQDELAAQGCGALLAVARGSAKEPQLVTLRHHGGGDSPWLGLVGKGVTFDSGGLSLKPTESMKHMKCDMAGAATVLGAMQAIGRLQLPVNVMGLCGLVENMIGPDSYRLGDVLQARNGRTIEVLNTDAEGRLVLADVLDVAVEKGAAGLIDLATLTGACLVALGTDVAGLMTNNDAWCADVSLAAEQAGERVWELPMFPEYGELIRSEVADIKNVGAGRAAGAITAAKFLEEFVGETPWTHIDIAGPAYLDAAKPWNAPGGTGALVATLVRVAQAWKSRS